MKVNDLVRHTGVLKSMGIGCVSKLLKKKVRVNFGMDDVFTCNHSCLELIDTSNCHTVTIQQYRAKTIMNDDSIGNEVIVGNMVRHYVGIGWVDARVCTEEDLKTIPRLIA